MFYIIQTVEFNGAVANDDTRKAMIFADFSMQQYVSDDAFGLRHILDECEENAFDIEIDEEDVRRALESVNVNKGAGSDGIPPKVLQNCAAALVKPLTVLFRKSYLHR